MNNVILNDELIDLIVRRRAGEWTMIVDGDPRWLSWEWVNEMQLFITTDGEDELITVVEHEGMHYLHGYGRSFTASVDNPLTRAATGEVGDESLSVAPMPGTVVSLNVSEGDAVQKGTLLLTIESMKMLTDITAQRDGTVAEIFVSEGEQFDKGAKLALLE